MLICVDSLYFVNFNTKKITKSLTFKAHPYDGDLLSNDLVVISSHSD